MKIIAAYDGKGKKGKGKRKQKKSCAKWCEYIPDCKWIPDCKDCGGADGNEKTGPRQFVMMKNFQDDQKMTTNKMQRDDDTAAADIATTKTAAGEKGANTLHRGARASSWLINAILSPFRTAAPHHAPTPGCPGWCEFVPGFKAKQWIPQCRGCPREVSPLADDVEHLGGESVAARVRAAAREKEKKMKTPCMKWRVCADLY